MTGFQILFTAVDLMLLAVIAVYLYKQFEYKLEYEQEQFEKMKRSVEYENTD